jgi:hypothetical protein
VAAVVVPVLVACIIILLTALVIWLLWRHARAARRGLAA